MTAPRNYTPIVVPVLAILLIISAGLSLLVGPAAVGFGETINALLGGEIDTTSLIIREVRLPRTILGITIGATLGLCGAGFQGYLRNPLAEPGIVGISSAAAFGAVCTFYFGLANLFALALPLGGMAGALLAILLIRALAGAGGSPLSLILAGIAITSFASALTSLALNLAPNPFAALEIVFWLLGSLADRSFDHVWLSLPFMIIGWIMVGSLGRPLDALTLGQEAAETLGYNIRSVNRRLIIGTALSVGAATAVAGAIGFVGLVVPHLLRPLMGHRPGALLLSSALGGALMVTLADIAVRLLSNGPEIKLGVLTALVGAPFFLMLILQQRRGAA